MITKLNEEKKKVWIKLTQCCKHSFGKTVIFSPKTCSVSSGVSWHTATHLSDISATTCVFKLRIHCSVTPAEWGWTLPIQKWLITGKAAPTPSPLVLSLSNGDMLLPDTMPNCYTRGELAHAMQSKRVNHWPADIFYFFISFENENKLHFLLVLFKQ